MNIEISGRNFEITDRIRKIIESKFSKVEKHFTDVTEMRCVLDVEKHRNICEIFVVGRNYDAKSIQESSETMDDAINSTFEALKRQARKHRDRLTDHRRRDGSNAKRQRPESWDIHVMPRKRTDDATAPRIIRTDTIPIRPMSVEHAAMTLDDSQNEFIVFRDLDTDRVTVIYKRADHNFGMIAPDF
jgi:putative sigma-54 modulation protein